MRAKLFGALCCCALSAASAGERTHEYRLDNGLRLIVQEDHRAPLAVVQVWYRVGSAYEHDGITGVSHALEHMMFKGTKEHGVGEFSQIVAARGGRENAFTSDDYTVYFEEWSADNVELSFKLEADRMRNLVIDDAEFAKEINVVLEERRLRTDDNPHALAFEAARATAYQTSPYRYPVIGWEADIKSMTADDLRAWYQRWYGPNNATVVVVGDVEPQAVHALAERYFGALAPSEIKPPKVRPEVTQSGTKRVTLKSDTARVPLLLMGYKAPALPPGARTAGVEDWEIYALDVLAETLDGGASARLKRNLVRGREIAAEIDAGYSSASALTTLFYFSAVPRDGTSLGELEQAIVGEIEALKKEPPSVAELERIKTQVVADDVFERDSMSHQAIIIGSLVSVGLDWRLKDQYVERIKAVTREQVLAVAEKYLDPDVLTVAYLTPGQQP